VMEEEGGCPLPDRFPSRPGMVFPLYNVLADLAEFAGAEVLPSVSSRPLQFDGLALQRDGRTRVLLANLTHEPVTVTVTGLGPRVWVRVLDEVTFQAATTEPGVFRTGAGMEHRTADCRLELEMRPFAYARLDCEGDAGIGMSAVSQG
jgi:hypothetical protein